MKVSRSNFLFVWKGVIMHIKRNIIFFLFAFVIIVFLGACNKTEFKISFLVDDKIVYTINTNGNEVIKMPENPTKEGYTFDGWYWDFGIWKKEFTTRSLLDSPLSSNMSVYAHFYSDSDLKGTDINIRNSKKMNITGIGDVFYLYVSNEQIVLKFNDYVEIDSLSKWELSTDITGNNKISSKTVELVVGDNPLYYIYVTDKNDQHETYIVLVHRNYIFNVSFDSNGGSKCDSVEVEEGQYLVNIPKPTKSGYTFDSWNFDFINNPINSDVSVKAKWNANSYLITLNIDGGECNATEVAVKYDGYYSLPTPTKQGNSFVGWYTNGGISYSEGYWNETDDIEVTAKWKANNYSIQYDLKDGTLTGAPSYYIYGNTALIGNPIKIGYEFTGWSVNGSNELHKDFNIEDDTYGDLILIANFVPCKYKIDLDSNGGICADTRIEIEYDSQLVLPTPTKNGYTFMGWYNNDTKIESGNWTGLSDLNLKAKWEIKNYKISYLLNGGINNVNNPDTFTFDTETIKLLEPTKTGYDFIGWSIDSDSPQKEIVIPKGTCEDQTYKANWMACVYTITLNTNGGDGLEKTEVDMTYDDSFVLPIPSKIGYKFKGWFNGDTIVNDGIWKISNDVELKANWEIIIYTISYDLNGGTNSSNPTSYNYESDDVLIENPTKIGYIFLGWTNEEIITPIKELTIKNHSTENIILSANWEAMTFKITYDVNGGNTIDSYDLVVTYDEQYELLNPIREGYSFDGWYNESVKVESGVWKNLNDIEIKAKWSIITYFISYDLDGGTNNGYNPKKYNYEYEDIIINEPTKKGYTFIGWTNDEIVTPEKEVTIPNHSYGDKNYKANWQINTYKLTYDVNGGDLLLNETDEIMYNSNFELLTPTRPGYSFDGWYSGDNKFESGKWSYITDINVKARWTIVTYSIKYDLDGGTASNNTSYNYETDSFALNSPEKEGHTFLGWTSDEIFVPTKEIEIKKNSVGNLSFFANWQINSYSVEINNSAIGISICVDESYTYNEEITITSTGNIEDGYTLRWIINGSEVKYGRKMSIIIPARNVTIDVDRIWLYSREGDSLYFGYYPQTKIDDLTIINSLNVLAGSLPTQDNLYNWSDYGYRNNSNQRYMYYIDVEYENNMYRGVYYTEYRITSSIQSSYQEYNGYPTNTVYWFLWEKVKWDIAKDSDGKLMLVTDFVIDSMNFDNGSQGRNCYYNRTTIKKWLNGAFVNFTFNNPCKCLLEDTYIESEANKLYILDTTEYSSAKSNISSCGLSDYALCQGYFTGYEIYWLRTRHETLGMQAVKRLTGEISFIDAASSSKFNELVKVDFVGVRPACWVNLNYYINGGVS